MSFGSRKTKGDEQTHAELLSIEGNDDEILDRFYKKS